MSFKQPTFRKSYWNSSLKEGKKCASTDVEEKTRHKLRQKEFRERVFM